MEDPDSDKVIDGNPVDLRFLSLAERFVTMSTITGDANLNCTLVSIILPKATCPGRAKRILRLRGAWMRLFAFRCVSDAFICVLISACTSLCLREIKYECEGKF